MASSTPRTPPPERPPPPVPVVPPPPPPLEPSPSPSPSPSTPPDPAPSSPGDEYHTPPPSPGEASPREEKEADLTDDGSAADASARRPPPSPVRLASPRHLPPPDSYTGNNGQEGAKDTAAPAPRASPQLRLATGLVRTPSQASLAKTASPSHGSLAKSPSPSPSPGSLAKTPSPSHGPIAKSPSPSPESLAKSQSPSPGSLAVSPCPPPSPTPPSPLTSTPAPAPTPAPRLAAPNSRSGQVTPKRAEAWKPPASTVAAANAVHFDPDEEAASSPLQLQAPSHRGRPRLDHHQRAAEVAENDGAAATAPPDVAAVAGVEEWSRLAPAGEWRLLSVTLRLATAVLSLVSFSLMASARTSGWAGDYYARHQQYRYAVAVNVIVCAYSVAQLFGEICSLSSDYFSLLLDQVLAYLLMSASSAAASRNDLWVSRFGSDPFTKKINSAVWLSFFAFLALAANSVISTANLFRTP
ncbi:hypothetical protein ACP4OV_027571 [Aristida adscensionis]